MSQYQAHSSTINHTTLFPKQDSQWWQNAVIYQIYPRSFQDSNNDGIGDLQGIIQRLDYIAALNVDAIWISPFFQSPMADFGYDISDYRQVDPLFGSLDDFDQLLAQAHARGLRVIIDQVLSHTSDQHAWFKESRSATDNDKTHWYVWADAKADGTPPNNWLSIFGGSAWQWDPRRQQYYLHNFLSSQPDLNLHNPALRKQLLEEVEFWLKRGVDGLRLDAIVHCFHDQQLRDNPARPEEMAHNKGCKPDNPYAAQLHTYSADRPENLAFIEQLRALLDRYPGTISLGEVSSDDSLATIGRYTLGNHRLHTAYCFELLSDEVSAQFLRNTALTLTKATNNGWPCWAIGNHDSERVISRWGNGGDQGTQAAMLTALITSMRGPICLYQGDELGLPESDVPYEQLQDPYGKEFWPNFKGRDGCRTPMPWDQNLTHAGFSETNSWLPIDEKHYPLSVEQQHQDKHSTLNRVRHFLAWRRQQPALQHGDIHFIESEEPILIMQRCCDKQQLIACFNLSNSQQTIHLPACNNLYALDEVALNTFTLNGVQLELPPYGVFYAQYD
ncbi:MAG: alpha glucosidase [Spongiibacteraceae bacterium]|nr:alpha glucosidase [Spongiibacteraceae bacterium]